MSNENNVPETAGNAPEPQCLFCGGKMNSNEHRKDSPRYHLFVPRCPICQGGALSPYFVKKDAADREAAFTNENSHKCTAEFHASRVAAPSQEAAPPTGQVQQWNGNLQSNGTVYEDAVLIEIQRGEIRKQQCEFEYIRNQIGPEKWAELFSDQQKIYAGLSAKPAPSPAMPQGWSYAPNLMVDSMDAPSPATKDTLQNWQLFRRERDRLPDYERENFTADVIDQVDDEHFSKVLKRNAAIYAEQYPLKNEEIDLAPKGASGGRGRRATGSTGGDA